MATNDKKQNFEDFEDFKKIQRGNLIFIEGDDIREHIKILLGPPDLTGTEVAASKDETKKLETILASNSKNPYVRARAEVLSKLKKSAVEKIAQMEKDGTCKTDKFYKEFTEQVIKLGDKYSLDKTPPSTDNVANN